MAADDHSKCDHPKTRDARAECRREARRQGVDNRKELSQEPDQIRNRARRHQKKMEAELAKLYKKPVEEWDMEELAHGKPRDKNGHFSGVPPRWVTRQVHEEAVRRFKSMLQSKVRVLSVPAVDVLLNLLSDNQMVYDDEGQPVRYIVPPSVKSQIGQYLIDQVVGKPTSPIETKGEVMHHIESVLAGSVVNVDESAVEEDEEEEDLSSHLQEIDDNR